MVLTTRSTDLAASLRRSGLRLTPQRRAVVDALAAGAGHPTAAEIHAAAALSVPDVSLATVYNTLGALLAIGAVHEVASGDSRRFEANLDPHINLICDACGNVWDAPLGTGLARRLARAAKASGLTPVGGTVEIRGRCRACDGQAPQELDTP